MKLDHLPDPERWSERANGTAAEDVVGASFRRIRTATEPSEAAARRWARRAMTTAPPRVASGRVWAIALAAAILAGGGVVAAGVALRAAAPSTAPAETTGDPAPAGGTSRPAGARHEQAPAVPPDPEPVADLAPPEPPPALPTALKAGRAARPAPDTRPLAEPPPAAVAEVDDEARLVARAFRHLRSEGDAPAALAALDQRERRFGAGTLASEAGLARAEALLLLGRTADALPILLALRDAPAGLTPEVRAVRAELLTRAKRCAEATADFDALLAPGAPAATRERALYGRASCRLQGARPGDAQPDLARYLAEFPHGRFAHPVREALEQLRRL